MLAVLILVLLALIAEAYINQHPALEILQYAYFKSEMKILGSISLLIMYVGFLLYAIAQCLLLIYDFQLKRRLIVLTAISFSFIIISFLLLFLSYNLQLDYSQYRYSSFILITIGIFGQMTKTIMNKANGIRAYNLLDRILKFPFYVLMFIGLVINVIIT